MSDKDKRNFTFTPIKVGQEGRTSGADAPRKIIGAKRSIKYRFSSVHISSDKVYNVSSTSSPFSTSSAPVAKTAAIYGGSRLKNRIIEPEIEAQGVNSKSPQCPYSLCIGKAVERESVLEHLITAHRVPVVQSSLATISTSMGGHDHSIQENMKYQWVPMILHCYDAGFLIFLSETKDYYSVWMSLSCGHTSNEGLEVRFDVQSYDARPNSNVKYLTWEGKVSSTLEVDICDTFIIMKDSLLKNFCMSRHGKHVWALDVTITKRSSTNSSPRSSSGYGSEDLLEDVGSEVSTSESLQFDFVDFGASQPPHMTTHNRDNNIKMESPILIRHLVDASTSTEMETVGLIEDNDQDNSEVAEIMQAEANRDQDHSFRWAVAGTPSPTPNYEEFVDCPCKPWTDDEEEDIGNENDNGNPDVAEEHDNEHHNHNQIQNSNQPTNSSDFDRLPAFVYFESTKRLLGKFQNQKYKKKQTNEEQRQEL